jgi:hypothetical protein
LGFAARSFCEVYIDVRVMRSFIRAQDPSDRANYNTSRLLDDTQLPSPILPLSGILKSYSKALFILSFYELRQQDHWGQRGKLPNVCYCGAGDVPRHFP